ncbi:MAG: hypothetical protein WC179_03760 [Candidatus Cloacimonadaceae bacterium]|jgi:DNA-binding transcriptional ArsR family regulator|nr:hypothetical protein [Candidatus Cloacimonadota bacterium]MCB5257609.1 hypothetical protein [Candidatus Cloacimonadota bacterium]MDD5624705.1 hypothetical protein [Candidatus Cloacimonadota bacterium]MDY0112048.1 hypothetical protein [Candidatus Syntrophosphaera sp.]
MSRLKIITRVPSKEGLTRCPLWINPDFMLAVQNLHHCEAKQLICYKGEEIKAVMPLYEKKRLGISYLICPLTAYYQGLWFFNLEKRGANRRLLDELNISSEIARWLQVHYKKMQFKLMPENYDVRGFTWGNFKAIPYYTFTYNFEESLELLYDERTRLKKASLHNYQLEEEFLPEEFIHLLKILYQRINQKLGLSYSAFQQWMESLYQHNLLTQFNLRREGKIVSSNIVLGGEEDDRGYLMMLCTLPEEMKNGASIVHYISFIESLKGRFDKIDFCGGNNPEVARFKAAMGFRLELFFMIKK